MEKIHQLSVQVERAVRLIVIAVLIFMLGTILLDVLARNTALRIRGLDELARYSLVWLVFLVTAAGARYGDLVGMESFVKMLPERIHTVAWLLRRMLFLCFLSFFSWYALGLVQLMIQTGRSSPNLHIPLWFVYAPIMLGSVLMFFSLLVDLFVQLSRSTIGTDPIEEEGESLWNS